MVFTVLCLSQMGNVLALRSEKESLFSQGLFTNKPLVGAFLLTVLLQMATIYVPFLNPIFKTQPLSASELSITLGLSTIVFFAVEVQKWVKEEEGSARKEADTRPLIRVLSGACISEYFWTVRLCMLFFIVSLPDILLYVRVPQ